MLNLCTKYMNIGAELLELFKMVTGYRFFSHVYDGDDKMSLC